MRVVALDRLTISGFRCFLKPIVIKFPTEGGFRYMGGVNKVDPSLGGNGAGKSTVWDALVWCLTGASVRGERAADLQSWGSTERPHVIAEYLIDGERHAIDRQGSPDVLMLNGKPVAQSTVDSLIGLTRARFLQSVVFGQSAKMFMDLSQPDRGELFDEIMGLQYWIDLSALAAKKAKALEAREREIEVQVTSDKNALDALVDQLEEFEKAQADWQAKQDDEERKMRADVAAARKELRAIEDRISEWRDNLKKLGDRKATALAVVEARELVTTVTVIQQKLWDRQARIKHDRELIEHSEKCPTCGQAIDARFATKRLKALSDEQRKVDEELAGVIADQDLARNELHRLDAAHQNVLHAEKVASETLAVLTANEQAATRRVEHLTRQLRELMDEPNPFDGQFDRLLNRAEKLKTTIDQEEADLAAISAQVIKTEFWVRGFRRVRLFMVNRILGMLDLEVAKAASELGVADWRISFKTTQETKAGTTRPGLHVTAVNPRGDGNYRSYSFGEAQRVRLAVSIGLASLIQNMAGVYHTLQVFDEPTAWLSAEGIDDLIECLHSQAEQSGRSIWLLDHRSMTYPFDEVWQVVKDTGASTVKRLT